MWTTVAAQIGDYAQIGVACYELRNRDFGGGEMQSTPRETAAAEKRPFAVCVVAVDGCVGGGSWLVQAVPEEPRCWAEGSSERNRASRIGRYPVQRHKFPPSECMSGSPGERL